MSTATRKFTPRKQPAKKVVPIALEQIRIAVRHQINTVESARAQVIAYYRLNAKQIALLDDELAIDARRETMKDPHTCGDLGELPGEHDEDPRL